MEESLDVVIASGSIDAFKTWLSHHQEDPNELRTTCHQPVIETSFLPGFAAGFAYSVGSMSPSVTDPSLRLRQGTESACRVSP